MSLISVEIVNPFIAATRTICAETLKLSVTAGKPRLCQADERLWKLYQLSAVIRLGRAVQGVISLSFSEHVARALAGGLAERIYETFDDDAKDALGEVANLIVGTAKRGLPGGLVTITLPKIVQTKSLEFPPHVPIILLPFESGPGRFMLQMCLSSATAAKSQTATRAA